MTFATIIKRKVNIFFISEFEHGSCVVGWLLHFISCMRNIYNLNKIVHFKYFCWRISFTQYFIQNKNRILRES